MSTKEDNSAQALARDLRVPPEFARYEDHAEAEVIVRLEQWKQKACDVLSTLRSAVHSREALSAQAQAEVVYSAAAFDGESPWVLEASRTTAQDILSVFDAPGTDLLERILRDLVKPVFLLNPHPEINIDTGRKLPRSAGGASGHLDYLEAQEWKSHPELYNVLSWCLRHVDSRAVERLWHLFIPPIMTYLDDYQAPYKLRGVHLVSELLTHAPTALLRRTGMDTLLSASLRSCLTFLHSTETPDLVRAAVPTHIRLTTATTPEGSAARFDQLCSLLGDGIVGNLWVYASRDAETIHASVDVLPELVQALGIGTVRFLKALIPQLVFPLVPAPENGASTPDKLSSARALLSVIRACAPRIHKWRGTILEAVLKCWVDLADRACPDKGSLALQNAVRSVCAVLLESCRSKTPEIDNELRRITALDPHVFSTLLESYTGLDVPAQCKSKARATIPRSALTATHP
ncbi:hypothetical protein BD413DRAFT_546322 [Trametes elegans]|nr:hypothetical protein BD413DRAFT_546322 [Trametes elegans]